MSDLFESDRKMLRILNGEMPDEQWGSWWTPCLEYLKGRGFCTRGPNYQITDKGREFLKGGDA